MVTTVIESRTKTALIGFDQPFCVIGERINPTGRKVLNEELERGDFSRVEADALAQVAAAGATLHGEPERSEFGAFGWFTDPAGNKIELWQPDGRDAAES